MSGSYINSVNSYSFDYFPGNDYYHQNQQQNNPMSNEYSYPMQEVGLEEHPSFSLNSYATIPDSDYQQVQPEPCDSYSTLPPSCSEESEKAPQIGTPEYDAVIDVDKLVEEMRKDIPLQLFDMLCDELFSDNKKVKDEVKAEFKKTGKIAQKLKIIFGRAKSLGCLGGSSLEYLRADLHYIAYELGANSGTNLYDSQEKKDVEKAAFKIVEFLETNPLFFCSDTNDMTPASFRTAAGKFGAGASPRHQTLPQRFENMRVGSPGPSERMDIDPLRPANLPPAAKSSGSGLLTKGQPNWQPTAPSGPRYFKKAPNWQQAVTLPFERPPSELPSAVDHYRRLDYRSTLPEPGNSDGYNYPEYDKALGNKTFNEDESMFLRIKIGIRWRDVGLKLKFSPDLLDNWYADECHKKNATYHLTARVLGQCVQLGTKRHTLAKAVYRVICDSSDDRGAEEGKKFFRMIINMKYEK